ncbi:MAG: hypothetical protein GSR72_00150 [Desulfurococcales archaeon]|nr:hypothetical protein [Desulfurococcales archaeon]
MKPHIAAALITSETVHRNLRNILKTINKTINNKTRFLKCLDLIRINITANHVCSNPSLLIEPYIYQDENRRKAKLPNLIEALFILDKSTKILNDKEMYKTINEVFYDSMKILDLIEGYVEMTQHNGEDKELARKIINKLNKIVENLLVIYPVLQYSLFVPVSQSILDACWKNQLPPSC